MTKFTVADQIVSDALNALEEYNGFEGCKNIVYGGIACQLYTHPHYPSLVRPTHDIDITVPVRLTSETFRNEMGRKLSNLLKQYNPAVEISRHVYDVTLKDADEDPLFMHSYKFTENKWERHKKNIERQISDSNMVDVPNSSGKIHIMRPEEMIVEKMDRLNRIGQKSQQIEEDYESADKRDWSKLSKKDFDSLLMGIIKQRSRLSAYADKGTEGFMIVLNEYRAAKDIYDIALISKLSSEKKIEFDEKYYDMIVQSGNSNNSVM